MADAPTSGGARGPRETQALLDTWLGHIQGYERAFEGWNKRVEKIIKRYRDDQGDRAGMTGSARFNILWSNTQVLSAATFARLPKPDVSRRFKDHDPVGRVASLILERGLEYEVEHYEDYRATLASDVLDRFLGGRATAWARYEPHMQAQSQGAAGGATGQDVPVDGVQVSEDADAPGEEVDYECAPTDYVHWKDFGHTLARSWEEVTAVWRKVYLDRDALVERFGEVKGGKVPLDAKPEELRDQASGAQGADKAVLSRGLVYEIWDKATKRALWISTSLGAEGLLDERDDPLGLEEFFPCPKPMYATLANDKLEPTPDFAMYQYQADQLDTLTQRIEGLVDMLRVMGVYDGSITELGRLFTEGDNGTLVPIKNWAAYAEKGKLAGAIEFTDLKPIYEALREAYLAMQEIKGQIYEITRISDIMRGEVDPREKLGQSQLKSQYGNLGIKAYQMQVAQFATDLLRLKAQIMCNKFSPDTLVKISAVSQLSPADQAMVPQALALLLGPRAVDPKAISPNPLRSFRVEIAADSLIQMDEDAEKDARMSFVAANSGFLKEAVAMLQGAGPAAPALVPLVMEIWRFGVTGFKVGKTIEGAFDEATQKLAQLAANPPPPPPDPKMLALQVDAKEKEGRLALENRKQAFAEKQHADEMQLEVMKFQKPEPVEPVDPEVRQAELGKTYADIDLLTAQAEKARAEAAVTPQKAAVEMQATAVGAEKTAAETSAIKMPVEEVDAARGEVAAQLKAVQDAVMALSTREVQRVERIRDASGNLVKAIKHYSNGDRAEVTVH